MERAEPSVRYIRLTDLQSFQMNNLLISVLPLSCVSREDPDQPVHLRSLIKGS